MSESGNTEERSGGAATTPFSLPPLKVPGSPAAIPTLDRSEPAASFPPPQRSRPAPDFSLTSSQRSRRGRTFATAIAVIVLIAAAIGGFVVFANRGPSGFTSPTAANAALFAAARSAGSFRYSGQSSGTEGGDQITGTVSGDAGRTSGIQFLISNVANYEVIVIGSVAYMKPDVHALENSFGYPASEAATYTNRWIELVPSDAPAKGPAAGVTTSTTWDDGSLSPSDDLPHTPRVVSPVTTEHGRYVQTVTYSMNGTAKEALRVELGSVT